MTPTYLEICKYIVGIGEFPKEAIIYAEVYQDSRPWREITTNGLKEHRTSLDDFESELAILAGDFSKVKKEDYFEIYETLCEYFPTQEVINVISKLPDVDFNRFTYSALRHYRIDLIDECVRRGINYTGDLDPNFLFKFCFLSKDNIPRAYFDSYMSNFYSGYPSYPTEETLFRD